MVTVMWVCSHWHKLIDNCWLFTPDCNICIGQQIVDVACGSGDAQTLAVTDCGLVFSWGDGDYGKLGKSQINISYFIP